MFGKVYTLRIDGKGPYGIRIKGGAEFGQRISIDNVTHGSKAQMAGFMVGDVILTINDVDLQFARHDVATKLITNAMNLVVKIRRSSSSTTSQTILTSEIDTQKNEPEIFPHSIANSLFSPTQAVIQEPKVRDEQQKNVNSRRDSKYTADPPPPARIRYIPPGQNEKEDPSPYRYNTRFKFIGQESLKAVVQKHEPNQFCQKCKGEIE
ncbi:PDZ and LIM domain protein Zasp [Thelohanellus kitauei]|uniref:PDZ and LIM domain protein Zasp n=1 Tax=Thelohanellus kitauei TaxID=669202 RepID=A0A0C2IJW8_THEKT|nr:PDZ and LIM domain protein Zasp [Thelohanellus kitauei]